LAEFSKESPISRKNRRATGRLAELESIINRGLHTYIQVGAALSEIREQRLYRQLGFHTFEKYCKEQWGWSRSYVNRQIRASQFLVPVGTNSPVNERQARRLMEESKNRSPRHYTDEDAAPELPETPVSAFGDLYILGEQTLLVGDATNQADVARLMASDTADLVFTDPPWNVDYEGRTEDRLTMQGDHMSNVEFKHFLEAACAAKVYQKRRARPAAGWHVFP